LPVLFFSLLKYILYDMYNRRIYL